MPSNLDKQVQDGIAKLHEDGALVKGREDERNTHARSEQRKIQTIQSQNGTARAAARHAAETSAQLQDKPPEEISADGDEAEERAAQQEVPEKSPTLLAFEHHELPPEQQKAASKSDTMTWGVKRPARPPPPFPTAPGLPTLV